MFTFSKMRIIAKRTLWEFWEIHSEAEQSLKSWFREMELGSWANLNQLKADYPSASIVKENRVVFNIKGNHFRLMSNLVLNIRRVGSDLWEPTRNMTRLTQGHLK